MIDRRSFIVDLSLLSASRFGVSSSIANSNRAAWMKGRWGLMVHWILPGTSPSNKLYNLSIQESFKKFELDRLISQIKSTNASWLIFTVGQNTGVYNTKSKILRRVAGATTSDSIDLTKALAKAIKGINKKFIAYIPGELNNVPSLQEFFSWKISKIQFEDRYTEFLAEIGSNLGKLCDGWWIDGFYNSGWLNNKERNWPLWIKALREGNINRALAFNDGSFLNGRPQSLFAEQDFLAGECLGITEEGIAVGFTNKETVVFSRSYKIELCIPHVLFPLDNDKNWVYQSNRPISPPDYPKEVLNNGMKNAWRAGFGITFNVGIYKEGCISDKTLSFIQDLPIGCDGF